MYFLVVFVCICFCLRRAGCRSCRSTEEKEESNGREASDQWGSAAALLVCGCMCALRVLLLSLDCPSSVNLSLLLVVLCFVVAGDRTRRSKPAAQVPVTERARASASSPRCGTLRR